MDASSSESPAGKSVRSPATNDFIYETVLQQAVDVARVANVRLRQNAPRPR